MGHYEELEEKFKSMNFFEQKEWCRMIRSQVWIKEKDENDWWKEQTKGDTDESRKVQEPKSTY